MNYLSDRTLAKRFEVSRATVWRWVAAGLLPKPIKFNGSTRWKLSDIESWEEEQAGVAQ